MGPGEIGSGRPSYAELEALVASQAVLICELRGEIEGLRATVGELQGTVGELRAQVKASSRNSSRPPSSDGLSKAPAEAKKRSLRERSGRKAGGQQGHRGARLEPAAAPDEQIEHEPERCDGCHADLKDAERVPGHSTRQVFDLPEPAALTCVEHAVVRRRCRCGRVSSGAFPDGVGAPTQYGPRIRALGVYLVAFQHLPYDRACQALADMIGAQVCPGTLTNWVAGAADGLGDFDEQLRMLLHQAPVITLDETGARIAGRLHWVHSASTATLTRYSAHRRRGCEAIDAAGVLPGYEGVAVHDGWKPYRKYTECDHGLCNIHHLRELVAANEAGHTWPAAMSRLLLATKNTVSAARHNGLTCLDQGVLSALAADYEQVIRAAHAEHPTATGKRSKAHNLLLRLDAERDDVLRFAHDFRVPFGNNQSEQDIRMIKLQQKISGCWRTLHGAERFLIIRSYISTARKNTLSALPALHQLTTGDPWLPGPAPT